MHPPRLEISDFGVRFPGSGFRVPGSGFRVSGFGFRVADFGVTTRGEEREGGAHVALAVLGQPAQVWELALERRAPRLLRRLMCVGRWDMGLVICG